MTARLIVVLMTRILTTSSSRVKPINFKRFELLSISAKKERDYRLNWKSVSEYFDTLTDLLDLLNTTERSIITQEIQEIKRVLEM